MVACQLHAVFRMSPALPGEFVAHTVSNGCVECRFKARSVSVDGRTLCAGSLYDGGFQILDVVDPAAPVVLSTKKYTMYNEGWGVVLKENLACVVDYFSGLFFMDVSAPQKPVTAGTFFTPSSMSLCMCSTSKPPLGSSSG